MKILKIFIIVIIIIVAIPMVAAFFVENDYAVEREITIDKPVQEVFDYIKYLKNQDNYSKWAKMDPEMEKNYTGTDGEVGFISAWNSDNEDVGKGEQEILKIADGERVDYELRFFEPFEATEKAYIITKSMGENETQVVWGFKGHMDYPMNLFLVFMDFEQMIGDDLSTGLQNLKSELEGS